MWCVRSAIPDSVCFSFSTLFTFSLLKLYTDCQFHYLSQHTVPFWSVLTIFTLSLFLALVFFFFIFIFCFLPCGHIHLAGFFPILMKCWAWYLNKCDNIFHSTIYLSRNSIFANVSFIFHKCYAVARVSCLFSFALAILAMISLALQTRKSIELYEHGSFAFADSVPPV